VAKAEPCFPSSFPSTQFLETEIWRSNLNAVVVSDRTSLRMVAEKEPSHDSVGLPVFLATQGLYLARTQIVATNGGSTTRSATNNWKKTGQIMPVDVRWQVSCQFLGASKRFISGHFDFSMCNRHRKRLQSERRSSLTLKSWLILKARPFHFRLLVLSGRTYGADG
jgi:hypothetical protein